MAELILEPFSRANLSEW